MRSADTRALSIGAEIGIVLGVTFAVLLTARFLPPGFWQQNLVPMAFLYPPLVVMLLRKLPGREFGLNIADSRSKYFSSLKIFLAACLLILVPYFILFHVVHMQIWHEHLNAKASLGNLAWMNLLSVSAMQIFAVALPEEFFFRGYLQTRLKSLPLLENAPIWIIFIVVNLLFASMHLLSVLNWVRLLTFFPGLIFSWLWWRTRQLWVPVLFHALCNSALMIMLEFYAK